MITKINEFRNTTTKIVENSKTTKTTKIKTHKVNESLMSEEDAEKILKDIQTKYNSVFEIVKSEFVNAMYFHNNITAFDNISDELVIEYLTDGQESSSVKFSFYGSDMMNTDDIIKIVSNLEKHKIDFYRIMTDKLTNPGYLEFIFSVEIEDLQNWK